MSDCKSDEYFLRGFKSHFSQAFLAELVDAIDLGSIFSWKLSVQVWQKVVLTYNEFLFQQVIVHN